MFGMDGDRGGGEERREDRRYVWNGGNYTT